MAMPTMVSIHTAVLPWPYPCLHGHAYHGYTTLLGPWLHLLCRRTYHGYTRSAGVLTMALPALQAYTPPATLGATLAASLDVLIMSAAWLGFVAVWTGG